MRSLARNTAIALALSVAILVVTGIIGSVSAQSGVTFALTALGASFLLLCKPVRFLGVAHRGVAVLMFVAAVLAAGMAYSLLNEETETRLAMLAEQDTEQYLAALREHSPDRWLAELERLDPTRHRIEIARIRSEETARAEIRRREEVARTTAALAERCKSDNAKIRAYVLAQQYVVQRLKSPGTADFPGIHKVTVQTSGECSFEIVGYVDAQNGFGALIRSNYAARITRDEDDDDRWRIDAVSFI